MPLETFPFDVSEFLDDKACAEDYLSEAAATDDPEIFVHALGVVARAFGMTQIARNSGVQREQLYRGISPLGRPELIAMLQRRKQLA